MASPRLLHGRCSAIGNVYVITTVVSGRRPVFLDPACAGIAIDAIRVAEARRSTRTFAWVIMPDHVHWMLQLRSGTLAECMQRFKSRSARLINRVKGTPGSLWQAGYFDHAIRDASALRRQARYIAENPSRAGLCCQPGDYPHAWCRWPEA